MDQQEKDSLQSDSESTFGASKISGGNLPSSVHTPGTDTLFNDDFASMNSQTSDDFPSKYSNREDSSSRSDTSVSLAGATVSENESFGLDSTNDEQTGNDDETETIRQSEETKTVQYLDTVYATSSRPDSSSESDFETEEVKYTSLTHGANFCINDELESDANSVHEIEV